MKKKISDDCNNVDGNSKYGSLRWEKKILPLIRNLL